MPKDLAIIIPVKNEIRTLEELVKRISVSLHSAKINFEIVVVDDYSTDGTWELAQDLQESYPLKAIRKLGKPGKAYSIIEGAVVTTAKNIAFIDGDLQYPPEAILPMYQSLKTSGLVIGKRIYSGVALIRAAVSKISHTVLGKWLFGITYDVQSGLKVFKREILEHLPLEKVKPWTLDLPLLLTAQELGHAVTEFDIEFIKRRDGRSKINLLSTSIQIGWQALQFRLSGLEPISIRRENKEQMLLSGVLFRKRRYVTHTSLSHKHSAITTFTLKQKTSIFVIILMCLIGLGFFTMPFLIGFVALLSVVYFLDVCFNFYLILRSLHFPPEIDISQDEIAKVKDKDLPIYTILCPLYKEAHVLPLFVESIQKIDWPKNKLDVILLLEEDDIVTVAAAKELNLPSYIRTLVVPDSQPKTKPKACNYGLAYAKGEYLVIYDAEDQPEPDQLKKVFLAFKSTPDNVKCIQAKLNYFNPHQNLLTRFFTAEYSLWFDVILTGLQSIETTIPLGGTSNHFRTQELQQLEGWDPFNVTEDCDLGIRLFKRGARTAVLNSITYEEANSDWGNWLRQRSRWIKGYIQTYLVHMRHPIQFIKEHGWHAIYFHLSVGGKIAFLFINPIMWLLTISYFALYAYVGPTIQQLYPPVIFYLAVTSLVFGNFMFIYYYMIGVAKREHWTVMKFVLLVPFYWLMTSIAACIGLYQLIVKPHYWEKTVHGLHLKKEKLLEEIEEKAEEVLPAVVAQTVQKKSYTILPFSAYKRLLNLISEKKTLISGGLLVLATMYANVLNFVFNIYLGRKLAVEDFGLLSLIGSLLFLTMIPLGSLGSTVNNRVGYLHGKYGAEKAFLVWNWIRKRTRIIGFIAIVVWAFCIPLLMNFFQTEQYLPFVLFTTIWFFGLSSAVDTGYLSGKLLFSTVAILVVVESTVKLLSAILLVELQLSEWVYLSIPLSILLSFVVGRLFILHEKKGFSAKLLKKPTHLRFPKKFFVVSVLSGISTMSFLSLDIIIIKHLLSPAVAGQYALISLVGKIVFFLSSLAGQFVLPLVSHNEGAQVDSKKTLHYLLLATALLSSLGCLVFGILAPWTLPVVFGDRIIDLVEYMPLFSFGMLCFSLSRVFMNYYLAKKVYLFSIVSFLFSIVLVAALSLYHDSLLHVVQVMAYMGIANLVTLTIMHQFLGSVTSVENNSIAILELFRNKYFSQNKESEGNLNILFFNWRDTKHVWAGGAEVYIHEIAKELIKKGHQVTVFCGNDGHKLSNETVEGVHIVRRGGFYTVYLWAFIYYMLKFRGKFDVVVDSENGLPFFTPLYVGVPKFLLIHHIHQEVFRQHLKFPFYYIAMFIESKLMPLVYKKTPVITVSESSRKAINRIGFNTSKDTMVINPGVSVTTKRKIRKTTNPSVVYIGRLKAYKNIDIALRSFAMLQKKYPKAHFNIAGDGELLSELKQLAKQLGISNYVTFWGKVSEEVKIKLLSESWVAVQPSMIEGWGITVIEANCLGTPVIASRVPGLQDSVNDKKTGLLVEPRNSKQLYEALELVVKNTKLRERLSNQAIVWSRNFNWEVSATKLLKNIFEFDVNSTDSGRHQSKSNLAMHKS